MGSSRAPSQRPPGMPGLNPRGVSDLEKAVLQLSIKGVSDKMDSLEEGMDSHYFAAVNTRIC